MNLNNIKKLNVFEGIKSKTENVVPPKETQTSDNISDKTPRAKVSGELLNAYNNVSFKGKKHLSNQKNKKVRSYGLVHSFFFC